jgi:N-acetyl-anhydromuramyl-L-alanine amidase AmpD
MKRIIIHWTAGGHTPSNLDRGHYHFIIAGDGSVVKGVHPVEANAKPVKGKYAAHTLNCNTGSIGVAVAAMAGAVERPFNAGKSPITQAQLTALAALCRDLAAKYKIPVTRETILSHAEVQPTLGIKQRGKWDIAWLPGMKAPGNPVEVGDKIRWMIKAPATAPKKPAQAQKPAPASRAKEVIETGKGMAAGGGLLALAWVFGESLWNGFVRFADWITFWN